MSARSALLLTLQFSAIGFLLATGRWMPPGVAAKVVAGGGLALIFWAVQAMNFRQLRLQPEPAAHAVLVTAGPYRWLRHPMYTGTLCLAAAWIVTDFTPARLVAGLVLVGALIAKARHEERLLTTKFPAYADWQKETWRLIPWIY